MVEVNTNFEIPDDPFVSAIELADAVRNQAGGQVPCMNDPDAWFPEKNGDATGNSTSSLTVRNAKSLCETSCEIVLQCRAHALKHHEMDGIWGGLTYRERRAIWSKEFQATTSRKGKPNVRH